MKKSITVRLPIDMVQSIDELAGSTALSSRNALVRFALDRFLSEVEESGDTIFIEDVSDLRLPYGAICDTYSLSLSVNSIAQLNKLVKATSLDRSKIVRIILLRFLKNMTATTSKGQTPLYA